MTAIDRMADNDNKGRAAAIRARLGRLVGETVETTPARSKAAEG